MCTLVDKDKLKNKIKYKTIKHHHYAKFSKVIFPNNNHNWRLTMNSQEHRIILPTSAHYTKKIYKKIYIEKEMKESLFVITTMMQHKCQLWNLNYCNLTKY